MGHRGLYKVTTSRLIFMKMDYIQAIKLVLKEGTTFDLYFMDGTVKRYNILSLSDKFPQLNALKDGELFLQGQLPGWGGVVWNDELDVGCETVYEEGIDVTDEYNDVDIVVFGYKVKKRRLHFELSQSELAAKIGIDQSDLSKVEKGLANPTYKMMKRIAKALECGLDIDLTIKC